MIIDKSIVWLTYNNRSDLFSLLSESTKDVEEETESAVIGYVINVKPFKMMKNVL